MCLKFKRACCSFYKVLCKLLTVGNKCEGGELPSSLPPTADLLIRWGWCAVKSSLCQAASAGSDSRPAVISALTAETPRNRMTALSYIMSGIDRGRKAAPLWRPASPELFDMSLKDGERF